jgi:fatty-acyl-CoA synthase
VRRFVDAYTSTGLPPEAMLPCYGMAEATLAISFNAVDEPMTTDLVDAATYASAGQARPAAPRASGETREFVSCGRVIAGHGLSVVDEGGRPLPERAVGEIVFTGPSVAAGYHGNAEATSAAFTPGGLKTGDLGYLAGGALFVTGRKKDLLILNGRNYDPQVVERTSEEVPGVRHGAVVAFTRPGADSEELVVAAEIKSPDADAVAEQIRRRVYDQLQLSVADVVITAGGSLPKTSSGKLQRAKARDQYLSKGMVCRN